MSKKKQTYNPCDDCQYSFTKNNQESGMCKICEFTYFKDRKQSEWISVDERLPDENVRVLVSLNHFPEMDTDRIYEGKWVRWSDVTHWMPLPEAPKMKGGAE